MNKLIAIVNVKEVTIKGDNEMTKLEVAVITEMGSHIYTTITVHEDYTMNEVVREIKRLGYVRFRLVKTMKGYATV